MAETPAVVVGTAQWRVRTRVDKYEDTTDEEYAAGGREPSETLVVDGNLLTYGGVSVIWQALIGNGSTTAGQALTVFNNANAYLCVGDGTGAAAATQNDLTGTNKLRKKVEPTYPQHTDGVVAGSATVTFQSVFGNADANWAWQEWGIANAATGGRLLNRKVEAMGTKTSTSVWTLTTSITLT